MIKLRYSVNITTGKKDVNQGNPNGEYPFFTCSIFPYKSDEYSFDCEALLVAGNGMVGYSHYYNGKFEAYQRTYVLADFKRVNPIFLKHYISEMLVKYLENKSVGSVIDFIKLSDLKTFNVTLPSLNKQGILAEYLDKKVAEIDHILEKTRESIEEYKKYKQSIITEAVTKGLNPNVEMKDSEIEWIDEIPENWDFVRLKYIFLINKEIAGKEGFDILSVTQSGLKIKDISSNEGQIAADYSKYQFVTKGDFVMNHMDLLTGWVDCSIHNGVTSPDYRVFRFREDNKHSSQYYKYIFQMCYSNKIFYGLGQGVSNLGRWRLQTDKFLNFILPIPPKEEQQQIVDYIDKQCIEIDSLISQKETLLKDLEAYKKSLIYEVVTGKKEVV